MPRRQPAPITTPTPQFLPPPVGHTGAGDGRAAASDGHVPPTTPVAPPAGVPPAPAGAPPARRCRRLPPPRHTCAGARRAIPTAAPPATPPRFPPARRADHHHGAAGVPDCRGAVHRPARRRERVAVVDDHADGDVQPRRAARPERAGRDVHAAGRRDGEFHAANRRRDRTRGHRRRAQRRSGGRVRARDCWRRCSSTPSAQATR